MPAGCAERSQTQCVQQIEQTLFSEGRREGRREGGGRREGEGEKEGGGKEGGREGRGKIGGGINRI